MEGAENSCKIDSVNGKSSGNPVWFACTIPDDTDGAILPA